LLAVLLLVTPALSTIHVLFDTQKTIVLLGNSDEGEERQESNETEKEEAEKKLESFTLIADLEWATILEILTVSSPHSQWEVAFFSSDVSTPPPEQLI